MDRAEFHRHPGQADVTENIGVPGGLGWRGDCGAISSECSSRLPQCPCLSRVSLRSANVLSTEPVSPSRSLSGLWTKPQALAALKRLKAFCL
jgi:hypothetical protein